LLLRVSLSAENEAGGNLLQLRVFDPLSLVLFTINSGYRAVYFAHLSSRFASKQSYV
jgi:hypothetical protein